MIMCNSCGNPFVDENVRFCSACGAQVPGWVGPQTNPLPPVNATAKNVPLESPDLPVDSGKQKDSTPHPYEERLKALEASIVAWISKNSRLSIALSVLSLVIGIAGLWFVAEYFKRRESPPPITVWIEVERNATWVEVGNQLRLTAHVDPPQNIPSDFRWEPAKMIDGNGQQSVWFKPPKDGRPTTYPVTISVKTFDRSNYPGPSATTSPIDVLPEGQSNRKPDVPEGIQVVGQSLDVSAGTSVMVEALATDKDGDNLTYSWSTSSNLVQIDGNGRKVTLRLPRDLARRANVPLWINLSVSDGKEKTAANPVELIVRPSGQVTIAGTKRKPSQNPLPQAQPPGTDKPNSSPPLAAPQATPSGASRISSLGPNRGRMTIQ